MSHQRPDILFIVLDAARALIEGSLVRAQKPPLLAAAVAMGHGGGELRTNRR